MSRRVPVSYALALTVVLGAPALRGQQASIHDAVRTGDLAALQAYLKKSPDLASAKDSSGRTPLHTAAGAGRDAVVGYLLSAGADVNATDNTGATALHNAAWMGFDAVARLLLEAKANADARDSGAETPLSKAAARGRTGAAARLLEVGATVDAANAYGRTPLSLVARESGNVDLARMLLDRKADVNTRDKFGDTPLQLAAWRGFRPVVDLLLERGASLPSDARARSQLIGQAAQNALESLFAKLLDVGVGVPPAGPGRRSLLHDAAAGGSVRILERLLATAPDINQADGDGWTPLHDAAFMARQGAIGFLLDKGADPNRRNRLGQSPWNVAVEHRRTEVADLLAARGADRSAPRFPALTGDYMEQTPPGPDPRVFAEGVVGGHFQLHSSIAFSPDGSEAYWSEMIPPTSPGYGTGRTMVSRRVNGRWTYPERAMVGSVPVDDVPVVSGDGKRVYDMSRRPLPGAAVPSGKENIWVADRAGTAWGEPRPLDQAVNALPQHWQFAVDRAGGVYFSSNWKGTRGLFYSPWANGRHAEAAPLPAPINANGSEGMPFIANDGSYLLFSRDMDIWVSFRGPDGAWKVPVRLPSPINTKDMEICPTVSPDGRALFFLRGELMWVDAGVIEELRAGRGVESAARTLDELSAARGWEAAPAEYRKTVAGNPRDGLAEREFITPGYRHGLAARRQAPDGDVFALLRAIDDAAARQAWPGFRLSDWPIAIYDGTRTLLLRHPAPPPEFLPLDGRPGVLAAAGRYPAVVSNSTIDLAGTRTATIVATPGTNRESTLLAYAEEVFHVFWLRRHTNFRPNEMARYGYPMKDARNLRLVLAEDEALARALVAPDSRQAASWAATMLQARREREPLLTPDDRAFETGLEMMEGTANAVARVVVGLAPPETARRLRADRPADQLRWRYYDSGAAMCLLLDRLENAASQPARRAQPAEPLAAAPGVGWKTRIDAEPTTTTLALLEEAVTRAAARPSAFAAAEWARFDERAATAIAELSARHAKTRDDLQARAGARIVVEIAAGREGLRAARFDPVNLLILDAGEMVHPRYLTLSGAAGTIEVTNPGYARGSFGGTVAITRPAGRHPLAEGVRSVTIVGVRGAPRVASRDGRVTVEFDGGRMTLDGAEARTEGETIRITMGR